MAGRGPAGATQHTRARNDKQTIKLVSDGKLRGPALPRNILKGRDGKVIAWHTQTVKWWNAWRKSPQAVRMMTDPDWQFLLDTALMHHEMWSNHRWELAAEVRLRVAKFGATPEDRARIRIEIAVGVTEDEGTSSATGNVSSISDRRNRMALEG